MATKRPKIIGIVGGSGSGKTTVTKRIIDELTQDKVALIEQDYYYKDQSHMTMDERVKQTMITLVHLITNYFTIIY